MAAYATTAEVQEEFKAIDFTSSTTAVTTTEIDRFLLEAQAEIHTYLATRYTIPITGTEALVVMRTISIWLVKSRIVMIMRQKQVDVKGDQDVGPVSLRKQAIDWLKMLASGKMVLSDAPVIATNHGGMDSYLAGKDFCYDFDRDKRQW